MNFFEADKKPAATMNSSVRSLALVVEDDQFEREVLGDLLKDENIEVIQCESAELVIAKVGAELKLLVTDVRLAGPGSGIELAEFAQQQFPHLHIVVVSGHDGLVLPPNVRFLKKPYRPLGVLAATAS